MLVSGETVRYEPTHLNQYCLQKTSILPFSLKDLTLMLDFQSLNGCDAVAMRMITDWIDGYSYQRLGFPSFSVCIPHDF